MHHQYCYAIWNSGDVLFFEIKKYDNSKLELVWIYKYTLEIQYIGPGKGSCTLYSTKHNLFIPVKLSSQVTAAGYVL